MSIFSHRSRSGRGFTLIELLVVISIMLILTSIFLIRQQRFNSSTVLRSLAYSIALSVRQAQVYGTSFKENSTANAYGIYISSGSQNSYILFADINRDGQYSAGENVQVFTLAQGYTISKFCATTAGGSPTQRCWTAAAPNITHLTILFKRPNPDACFATSANNNACAPIPSGETYSSGYIQLMSGSDTRSVNVTLTGQITVGGKGT
jgi:prepilin-type N-terminal cleavage/methylation domain-containing protein